MSRSGYDGDCDSNICFLWDSAIAGERGQKLLSDLCGALDAMPVKELIVNELVTAEGGVCALGALGRARGIDMSEIDPGDVDEVAGTFNVARALAADILYANDEAGPRSETPAERWVRIRAWVAARIDLDTAVKPTTLEEP